MNTDWKAGYDQWKCDPTFGLRDEPEDVWYEIEFDEFDILDYFAEAFETI